MWPYGARHRYLTQASIGDADYWLPLPVPASGGLWSPVGPVTGLVLRFFESLDSASHATSSSPSSSLTWVPGRRILHTDSRAISSLIAEQLSSTSSTNQHCVVVRTSSPQRSPQLLAKAHCEVQETQQVSASVPWSLIWYYSY